MRWLLRILISRIAFRFALIFWRASELFDKIPGFNEGFEEAYSRHIARHPYDNEE